MSFLEPVLLNFFDDFGQDWSSSYMFILNHDGSFIACRASFHSAWVTIQGRRDVKGCLPNRVMINVDASASAMCFVHRRGIETLLVSASDCFDEFTLDGVFLRRVGECLRLSQFIFSVAYSDETDVLAVSQCGIANCVKLFRYDTGEPVMEVDVHHPNDVAFTDGGRAIVVASSKKTGGSLRKFRVADGMFLGSVFEDLGGVADLVAYEGGICVTTVTCPRMYTVHFIDYDGAVSVIFTGEDLVSIIPCKFLFGLIIGHRRHALFFSDAWHNSSRCAWVSACSL